MNGWAIFGMICAAAIVLTVAGFSLASLKDVVRYIKISIM